MSGLSRLDPEVAAGTVTVRCLLGGFDQPAVGAEVKLEVTAGDGRTETRTATADGEGRATFAGLDGFVGGQAIASVDFDGEVVRSREIPLAASAGSRVMLVKGAPSAAPVGGDSGAERAGIPEPGKPFSDPRFPKGTLVIGALDLSARRGLPDVEVRLEIRPPEGEAIVRTAKTDREGRALFDGLDGEDVPEGSVLVAEATLREGEPVQRSVEFNVAEQGQALVFTVGQASASPAAPTRRRPVMPPRLTPTVKAGAVRVSVVDADDQPVSQQTVEITQFDVTGAQSAYEGVSGPDGVAYLEGITVNVDAAYQIEVDYKGAPFRSSLFRLHESMGAIAEVRVFPTTSDVSRIRTAAQLEIAGRENDLAQVTQLYQVFVDGDEAFWPGRPLKVEGGEGAIGFVVMERAAPILEHNDKAPFATLSEPIPPGEVVDLSFAYLVEHDGEATIRWTPTLPLLEGGALLPKELNLAKGAKGPPKPPPQAPEAPYDYYELGPRDAGVPLELVVEGLPVRPRIYRELGLGFGLGILGILGIVLLRSPRRGVRERLLARKRELVELIMAAGDGDDAQERRMLLALELDRVIRQLEALGEPTKAAGAKPEKPEKPEKPTA
ncbi:MAG: hypothetical protein KC486_19905 [Myxococcales bacterium]|nr:hypothetical protein [Myxococcales bacterium]